MSLPLRRLTSWIVVGLGCVLLGTLLWWTFGLAPPPARPEEAAAALPPFFADVTAELGLDFVHDAGAVPLGADYFLPQIIGSGAALFDFDDDGRLDILLLQNGGPHSTSKNKLFHQQEDGKFKDVSVGSGLDYAGCCMGVAVGDVNNDGLPDVYISEYGGGRLFLNRGKGRFDEVRSSGVDNFMWGTAASFVDYDRDGWLDLVVVNYVDLDPAKQCTSLGGLPDYCHPNLYKGTETRLYRNRGLDKDGKWLGFEDRTAQAGLDTTLGPGLGVLCADFDGDGWPDIFVANDARANHLWINQRNGKFNEEAIRRGLAFNVSGAPQGNMGVAYGDVDHSGLPALFVTHLTTEYHSLWKQGPRGYFQDQFASSGMAQSSGRGTGFGTFLADFDNDGYLDLAITNGRVAHTGRTTQPFWDSYAMHNQLFLNDGGGKFRDISTFNPALCAKPMVGRGLAVGDIDGDGGLDLLVTQVGGPVRLLRNVAPNRGHWLMVRAVDPALKRDAIGAEVRVRVGSKSWQALLQPSQSYLVSNDPRVHFGLGSLERIDAIEVLWPDGREERFPCPAIDRVVRVERGQGESVCSKEKESRP